MSEFIVTTPPSLLTINPANPSAGRDFQFNIPNDRVFLIHSVHMHFTAGAGGANRATLLQLHDGTSAFLDIPIDSNIPPSGTVHYSWAAGFNYKIDAATNAATAPLPANLYLPAAFRIKTLTANIGGFDQFTEIFIYISPFILPVDRG